MFRRLQTEKSMLHYAKEEFDLRIKKKVGALSPEFKYTGNQHCFMSAFGSMIEAAIKEDIMDIDTMHRMINVYYKWIKEEEEL
jgi:hypothetical protein